ncbi:MFS general substrate transporter [Dichomitus squalens]|uniref:MFS general substrate transporter n=1 Tax=Dichomitus squalens TaxID=114155 RepID=A0A4Q9N5K6_9APHY|nr:MFS general substrate transporter [Dichomitus squalens]
MENQGETPGYSIDTAVTEPRPHAHPDGGVQAWLVCAGGLVGTCATFGLVNAWGVFQAFYTEDILLGTPPSTIAWIGSVQYALVFLPGLIMGRIFDLGYTKMPLIIASALLVAATFLTAQCKEFWQFLLCQGIATGLACGCIFGIVIGTPGHWFKRRLGLALSITAVGSSVGGTVYPIMVKNLMSEVGFQWTMRILGFLELALCIFTVATIERRLPPRVSAGPFVNLAVLKSPSFTLYCFSSFTLFLGLYTVLTYIDVSAVGAGVPDSLAFYLVAIANACSAFGRITGGILSDRAGPLNIMIPFLILAGIMTYIWPFVTTTGGYIAIAVVYGFASSGVYVGIMTSPAVRMGDMHDVGSRVGISMTITALGAVAGPPISGALNAAGGTFKYTGVFAGASQCGTPKLYLVDVIL